MMRSESTRALGQPRLTKTNSWRGLFGPETSMGALIGKRETLVCRRV